METPCTVPHPDVPLSLTEIPWAFCHILGRDALWPGEVHSFWELLYVSQGSVVVTAGREACTLHQGEALFHAPGTFHNFRAGNRNPAGVTVLSFRCSDPRLEALPGKIFALTPQEASWLDTLVRESRAAFSPWDSRQVPVLREDRPPCAQQILRCLAEALLLLLLRPRETKECRARYIPVEALHFHSQLAVQVTDYLRENYSRKLTLEEIARHHHISQSLLKKVFTQYTGKSLITYLTDLRIRQAKTLIREGNLNFSQIAVAVGYENIYYFSSVFKRCTGITPTEYAKTRE